MILLATVICVAGMVSTSPVQSLLDMQIKKDATTLTTDVSLTTNSYSEHSEDSQYTTDLRVRSEGIVSATTSHSANLTLTTESHSESAEPYMNYDSNKQSIMIIESEEQELLDEGESEMNSDTVQKEASHDEESTMKSDLDDKSTEDFYRSFHCFNDDAQRAINSLNEELNITKMFSPDAKVYLREWFRLERGNFIIWKRAWTLPDKTTRVAYYKDYKPNCEAASEGTRPSDVERGKFSWKEDDVSFIGVYVTMVTNQNSTLVKKEWKASNGSTIIVTYVVDENGDLKEKSRIAWDKRVDPDVVGSIMWLDPEDGIEYDATFRLDNNGSYTWWKMWTGLNHSGNKKVYVFDENGQLKLKSIASWLSPSLGAPVIASLLG